MYTKRQLIDAAFEELGLAAYAFDTSPEEQGTAIRRLDSMMALWDVKGIRIGYALTVDPDAADPDQMSGLPDWANEAVFLNLAVRLAPGFGKTVPRTTSAPAKDAYDTLLAKVMSNPPQMQPNVLPAGAGNRRYRGSMSPFLRRPVDLLTAGPDSLLEFDGPVPLP